MVSEMEAWPGHRRHRQRLDHWTRQMLGPRGLGSQRHEALAQSFGARFATRREPQGGLWSLKCDDISRCPKNWKNLGNLPLNVRLFTGPQILICTNLTLDEPQLVHCGIAAFMSSCMLESILRGSTKV